MKNNQLCKVNYNCLKNHSKKICKGGIDLVKKMLAKDPAERVLASEALAHDYFTDVRCATKSCVNQSYVFSNLGSSEYKMSGEHDNCVHESDILTPTGVPNRHTELDKSDLYQGSVRNLGKVMNHLGGGGGPDLQTKPTAVTDRHSDQNIHLLYSPEGGSQQYLRKSTRMVPTNNLFEVMKDPELIKSMDHQGSGVNSYRFPSQPQKFTVNSFPKKSNIICTHGICSDPKEHRTSFFCDTKDDESSFLNDDLDENPGVISFCGYSSKTKVNTFVLDKHTLSMSTVNDFPRKADASGSKTDPTMESVEMGDLRKNILVKKSGPGEFMAHSHGNVEIYTKKDISYVANGHPMNFSERIGRPKLNTESMSSSSTLF